MPVLPLSVRIWKTEQEMGVDGEQQKDGIQLENVFFPEESAGVAFAGISPGSVIMGDRLVVLISVSLKDC